MPQAAEKVMPAGPRVAIVVPSFQQGGFLPYALESLARQTYDALETAVFDNLSTDATADVLRRFEGHRTRVVRTSDRGQADALRRAFAETDADVLGWLNADDMLFENTIERVASIFRDEPHVDVIYGHCAFVSENGQFLGYFHDIQDFRQRDLNNFSDFIPQPSTFFRRSAYEAAGGIDASLEYAMDWDLWCRMAKLGARFSRLDEVLSAARIHPAAKTSRGGRERSAELFRVNHRHASFGVPFVAVAHFYHRHLRRRIGPLALIPRLIWSQVLGAPRSNSVVLGLAPAGRIKPGKFRLRFPVFGPMRELRLKWTPEASARVTFEGPTTPCLCRVGNEHVFTAETPRFLSEVNIAGALADGPEATLSVHWS